MIDEITDLPDDHPTEPDISFVVPYTGEITESWCGGWEQGIRFGRVWAFSAPDPSRERPPVVRPPLDR